MKIAAGIILIVAAIMNIFGGSKFVLTGGAATVGAMAADALNEEAAKQGIEVDEAAKAQLKEGTGELKTLGTGHLVFGLFLWVMFVMQIVGAVFLFISKSKMFIFIVAVLSVLAEVGSMVLTPDFLGGGFGWTNIFGLLGGVLAFVAAMSIGKAAAPAAPAAPDAPAAA